MITTLLLLAATATTPALPAVTPDTIDFEAAKALADRDEKAMTKLAADAMKKSQWGVLARAENHRPPRRLDVGLPARRLDRRISASDPKLTSKPCFWLP